jgi:DNA-binding transcriptional regulator YdaS (Cro superfamily)
MQLNEYLKSPGALTVRQLAEAVGVKSDMQVRQWQHGYGGRRPSPIYCHAIERATLGQVTRKDLRPNDWQKIWPELADTTDTTTTEGQGA